jgi:hypothetical protein
VTPVMERCPCSWPMAECVVHSPPKLSTPVDDDPDGIAQPTTAAYILAGASLAVIAGWATLGLAVWGAWKLGTWAVGRL